MNIGELIRRIVCTRQNEVGAIDFGRTVGDARKRITEADESDLLNGPHKICECGSPGCGCPIPDPRSSAPGR